jgi:hypothetical protein
VEFVYYNPAAQQALKRKMYFFCFFLTLSDLKQISQTSSRTIPKLIPELFGSVRTRIVEARVRFGSLIFKKAHLYCAVSNEMQCDERERQRCQMPLSGKRQIQHGKMPKTAKCRFKKRQVIFTPVGSRF